MVGEDRFGRFLEQTLINCGIETKGLKYSDTASTTLAVVDIDEGGDRSFSFLRRPGADTVLRTDDVDLGLIDAAKIFHFGSLSLTDEPARSATLAATDVSGSAKFDGREKHGVYFGDLPAVRQGAPRS